MKTHKKLTFSNDVNMSSVRLEIVSSYQIRRSKMTATFTEENMKTLIKEIFQEEFKKQAENITNLVSCNFKLTTQEIYGLENEINDLKKALSLHKTT